MSSIQKDLEEERVMIHRFKKDGDLEVLGRLYQPYMHLVYGVCLKYFKNREEAQDAVMQIFEKLIISLPQSDVKNFKSWLFVVTKNHCLMKLRSNDYKRNQKTQDVADVYMENSISMHPLDEEENLEGDLSKLEECLAKLKLEQKTCIDLFYLEKKTYIDIVKITNYDINKVKSYIQNGKRNLKQCMNN